MTRRGTVLVARLDNAGDVLLQGPLVRAVAHGAERVVFLAGPARNTTRSAPSAIARTIGPWRSTSPALSSRATRTVRSTLGAESDEEGVTTGRPGHRPPRR